MSYEFKFPDIGEGLTEGKILEFRVNPGDPVIAGDILAIVETDKVVAEIASPRSGVLVKFGSAAGTRIRVGQTLAYIEVADEAAGNGTGTGTGVSADGDGAHQNGKRQHQALVGTLDAAPSTLAPSDEPVAEDPAAAGSGPADPPRVTPAARRLAREMNVDLARCSPAALTAVSCAGTSSRPPPNRRPTRLRCRTPNLQPQPPRPYHWCRSAAAPTSRFR